MRSRAAILICALLSQLIPAATSAAAADLQLTRLLIDPAAPLTDAVDETVELTNTGTSDIDLAGYSIKVGDKTYGLPSGSIAPGATTAITAAEVTWALANAGGTISLLQGAQTLDTTSWPKAQTGAWWTKGSGSWSWQTDTPGRGSSEEVPAPAPISYAPLEITELLPDPAPPLTDADDEYIELYNPTGEPVDTEGYIVKTGASLGSTKTLPEAIVPAGGYLVLKSSVSHVTLANAGSSVALFDPDGNQIGATITYPKAPPGAAFARFDGRWDWTTEATPATANVLAAVAPAAAKQPKAAAIAKTTKPKAATSKSTKAKTSNSPAPNVAAASIPKPSATWLLFALAGLTIAYVIYEFRYDLRHLYYRLRGYPGGRPAAGEATARRGSHRTPKRSGRGQDDLRPRSGLRSWLRRRSHQPDLHPQPGVQAD
jgi:hypothetical protein